MLGIKNKIVERFHAIRLKLSAMDLPSLLSFQFEVRPYLENIPYWAAAAVVGVAAVGYSSMFTACVSFAREVFERNPYILFVTSPLFFFLASWMVDRFAPEAGGTGVPRVIRALKLDPYTETEKIHAHLNLRVALVVTGSSLFCMLGAGSLGREGPMIHIAACLFYFVGTQLKKFWPYREHRSWIVAGGAAGVAAAFNAPLAGVVFVLEELAQQHFHQFKTVVVSAAIIGGMMAQGLSGKYLYFGFPKVGAVPFTVVPWAILIGLLSGILAYPFQKMIKVNWKEKMPRYFQHRLKFAALIGVVMAAIAVFLDPGSIGGGFREIEGLLKEERASWSLLLSRFFGTIASHLSGCAGGFLAPSLALGAIIGSLLSELSGFANHNLFVLVGMAAFLSANLRAPFTAWVIVLEMTDRHSAIFPLMIASVVSNGMIKFLLDRSRKSQLPPTPSQPDPF